MSVVKLFKSLHLQFFSYCQTKLGTHDLFPNTLNNEQIFKILIFKFFGDFFLKFHTRSEASGSHIVSICEPRLLWFQL